ncbi:MAG: TonB-dependent receptor [Burkholderiales bacterium]|nr:TonB-dependent receptor [Burkholderiales bacterium]
MGRPVQPDRQADVWPGFRAPAFVEMYAINNPAVLGNPNLKPETTDTWEAAVAWQPSGSTQLGVNVYQFQMNDVLRFVPNSDATTGSTAQNTGQQRGHGLELEASWNASSAVRLSGNYSYQRLTDANRARSRFGTAPQNLPARRLALRGRLVGQRPVESHCRPQPRSRRHTRPHAQLRNLRPDPDQRAQRKASGP